MTTQPARNPLSLFLAVSVALGPGCQYQHPQHHQNFPPPMTPLQLASINTGGALVSYLRQRDASAEVCSGAS
ncbi:MAG: hypothetical protein WCJ30_28900, partial [Deltaproteobacteria bacterium]